MKYNYEDGLQKFSKRTDEKILLAIAIHTILYREKVKSLLDVGSGGEGFASLMSEGIYDHTYTAIEKRGKNASALKEKGLRVIEAEFPTPLSEKFDMVLASHSLPTEKDKLQPFVEALVQSANEKGVVCVITSRSDKDTWYKLMHDTFSENWHGKNYDTYEMLFDVLKHYGDVSVEKIDTAVRGKTPRELVPALRFIYAGKDAELAERFNQHRSQILTWIKEHCKTDRGYTFPFFQYVVTLKKHAEPEQTDQWATLINHPRHELTIEDAHIVVEDGVFTPNPEITYSTSMILEHLPKLEGKRVADVGTGSGAIGVIAARRGAREVVATDISETALQNAITNVEGNDVGDIVTVVKANLLEGVEGKFDYIFANIPILDEVWGEEGVVESTVQKLLSTAEGKLNQGGKIYIPWGSFAEDDRKELEKMVVDKGYRFGLHTKEALGHRWYLYVLSQK